MLRMSTILKNLDASKQFNIVCVCVCGVCVLYDVFTCVTIILDPSESFARKTGLA